MHDYTTIAPGALNDASRGSRSSPPRAAARAHPRHHPRELPRRAGVDRAAGACALARRPRPARSSTSATHADQLDGAGRRVSASELACSSCPAITSTWTAICGSDSDRTRCICSRRSIASAHAGRPARMRADLALIGFGNVGRRLAACSTSAGTGCRSTTIWTAASWASARAVTVRWSGDGVIDAADAARTGGSLPGLGQAGPPAILRSIARLGRSAADLRVVVETTVARHQRGTAGDGSRGPAWRRMPRRDREQGSGGVRVRGTAASARSQGVSFLFEGAVMDGIPVFNLVRETLPAVEILGFRGVINSTTNHILTALEDGEGFDARAGEDAGRRDCRGRPLTRRGRLGRGRQDRGARQRTAWRADDAARGTARGAHRRRGARRPDPSMMRVNSVAMPGQATDPSSWRPYVVDIRAVGAPKRGEVSGGRRGGSRPGRRRVSPRR